MNPSPLAKPLRHCGLCGSQAYRRRWTIERYDIGKCLSCGLVQVMQDVTDAELDALYSSKYYEGGHEKAYQNYLADPAAKAAHFGEQLEALMSDFKIAPAALLEIGCAFGLFLNEARKHGWRVRGTERSTHSAEWARRELGLEVDTSPDALSHVPSASQDLVVMWDVIEHVKDPGGMVKEIRRILKPGGLLALTTGDIGSLGARFYGKRWYLVAPPYHLFYFDRSSMRGLLTHGGFAPRRMSNTGGHPLECAGRGPRLLQWIARKDRYLGWRLKSGPIIDVVATAV